MLLFYAGVSLRDGALKSGPKACRERPTVKEEAASSVSLRPVRDEGNQLVHSRVTARAATTSDTLRRAQRALPSPSFSSPTTHSLSGGIDGLHSLSTRVMDGRDRWVVVVEVELRVISAVGGW